MRFSECKADTVESLYNEFLVSYANYTDKEKRLFVERVKYEANDFEVNHINIYRFHMLGYWLNIKFLPDHL